MLCVASLRPGQGQPGIGGSHPSAHTRSGSPWRTAASRTSGAPSAQGLTVRDDGVRLPGRRLEDQCRGHAVHLCSLDDPEVRDLAAKYGDPDRILAAPWKPGVPGLDAPGSYDEYGFGP